jgi:hypothetical protein
MGRPMMVRPHTLLALAFALPVAGAWSQQPDRPPRLLVVTVRDERPSATGPEAAARAGSVVLSTGRPLQPDPVGNGQTLSTHAGQLSAEVLEGEPFRISMPAPQSLWVRIHGGSPSAKADAPGAASGGRTPARPEVAGVVHFDAVSDFTARVRVAGATVAIDLQPLVAGSIDGGTDVGPRRTTVTGRLGQWIELAESGPDLRPSASAESGAAPGGLWIKVEAAP